MTVRSLIEKLNLKLITNEQGLSTEINSIYICDLLSWVMSHLQKGDIWITVQTNINIIAVASLTEAACIIVPEDITIEEQTIKKANDEQIPLFSTTLNSYEIVSLFNKEMLI